MTPLPPPTSSPMPASAKATCEFCGHENDPASRFCLDCGKPLSFSAEHSSLTPPPPAPQPNSPSASNLPATADAGLKCRKCGKTVDSGQGFCGFCGTRVLQSAQQGKCRNCGVAYVKGVDTFCATCGTRVGERVSISTSAQATLAATIQPSGPSIAVLDEQGRPTRTFTLDRGEALIGRGDADIRFEFDVYLSPLHARIDLKDDQLWLRDLGSRNGSWIFIDEATKLIDGDLILIGSQVLRFRRLGYPGPHPPEADATRRMGSVTPPVDVAVLEQMRADGSVRDVFHLSPGRTAALGRETGDWVFPYDQTMSGKHAEIVSEDIEFFVNDAESRNGVAMSVRGDRELKPGQRFLLGDQILRVETV